MIFATPQLSTDYERRLDRLDEMRRSLAQRSRDPVIWMGVLRRSAEASSVASSTAIEGFHVSQEDALALLAGRQRPAPDDVDRLAVACYGRAIDHVRAMADDPDFRWLDRVILDLHFDACQFQRDKRPGRWRQGPIGVTAGDGGLLYEGPPADEVPSLMVEVADWLQEGDREAHPIVRAAMAHLHVVGVHPFSDGNGRVARIVQSLVLARDGLGTPELTSIEEYLRDHTRDYYAALQTTGATYQPSRDATGWVEFCVDAHLAQAQRRLDQIEMAGNRWTALEQLAAAHGWPDRMVIALEQSLMGTSDRATYASEAEVSPATATNDFRQLLAAGLVEQVGKGRGTRYLASERLRQAIA